jgi:hypothetical protein
LFWLVLVACLIDFADRVRKCALGRRKFSTVSSAAFGSSRKKRKSKHRRSRAGFSEMSALSDTPKCKATREELLRDDTSLRLLSECPLCALFNVRCPVGCHPSSSELLPINRTNVWIYQGTITNSKLRKCCRFKVYNLAEQYRAKVRVVEGSDGIRYDGDSNNLKVTLVFEDQIGCEEFQTQMRHLPLQYRMRKPDDDSGDISVADSVVSASIQAVELRRIWSSDYAKIDDDANPSAVCDSLSDLASSYVSAVELSEEVKLRLLDNPTSLQLTFHRPEKCHLKSQTHFPQDKSNPNNILYMSRFLHEGFDGINQVDGVPDFALRYHGHSSSAIKMHLGGGRQAEVFEVTVRVEFQSEHARTLLTPLFKKSTRVEGYEEIELKLYVKDPEQFKDFLDHKHTNTHQRWASLRGVEP